jgi:Putative DNA-binding domain
MSSDTTPISVNVASSMILPNDQDILAQLTNFENSFVERKTGNDSKDWLKTAVAFANTTPIGYPAIMFVGVKDDGEIEGTANFDNLQRTLSKMLAEAYPTIYYHTRILKHGGKQFLAVIIPGSEYRPHFAGKAFVRDGSHTVTASAEQYARLIAERNSKAYEILKWREKKATLALYKGWPLLGKTPDFAAEIIIIDCNQFYVTYAVSPNTAPCISHPLARVEVSFDHRYQRLELRWRQDQAGITNSK